MAQTAADPLVSRMAVALEVAQPELIAFRRDLHQHPELSGEGTRTAARVAARLRGGQPGPVVAFRADMDAVPSSDPDPVEFPSLTPGVRHICGHDVHTTLGVALATAFVAVRGEFPGSLLLLFQPAEERATGARAMLADDAFSLARPAASYEVHTAPLEVGTLGVAYGPLLAGRDRGTVTPDFVLIELAPARAATGGRRR
jgi:metal-dependent amidase/aminoacylase/carboxypeptidase family protein